MSDYCLITINPTGQSFALVGVNVDQVDVQAIADLQASQQREVQYMKLHVASASLADVQELGHPGDADLGVIRCPMCPYYKLTVCSQSMQKKWKKCLLQHLHSHHRISRCQPQMRLLHKTKARQHKLVGGKSRGFANLTAVGFKQFSVLRVLFNGDRMLRKCSDNYLVESARILREPLPTYSGHVDRATVKMLTRTGVKFVSASEETTPEIIKIGTVFVTKGFVELYFSEYLLNDLRIEKTRHRLVVHFLRCGCRYAELMPTKQSTFWIHLMERIIFSTGMQNRKQALILECADHDEFSTVSMDGLLRPAMRVMGQADYRASTERRNAAPIADDTAMRRLITVRGRTGAVLMVKPCLDESAPNINRVLENNVHCLLYTSPSPRD